MSRYPNPFGPGPSSGRRSVGSGHSSDHPGRDYPDDAAPTEQRHLSSGASGPSEPRRAGTGERQAPRRGAGVAETVALVPGEVILAAGDVEINAGLPVTTVRVVNTADRPIQVGSHFHFAEVNAALDLDRSAAWGRRLNVLAGGAMRFEPGAAAEVELVPLTGRRIVPGLRGLCGGALDGQD